MTLRRRKHWNLRENGCSLDSLDKDNAEATTATTDLTCCNLCGSERQRQKCAMFAVGLISPPRSTDAQIPEVLALIWRVVLRWHGRSVRNRWAILLFFWCLSAVLRFAQLVDRDRASQACAPLEGGDGEGSRVMENRDDTQSPGFGKMSILARPMTILQIREVIAAQGDAISSGRVHVEALNTPSFPLRLCRLLPSTH